MPAPLSPRPEAAVLPSIPPSPSLLDEVFGLGQPRPWSVRLEASDLQALRRSLPESTNNLAKSKVKQLSGGEAGAEDEHTEQGREAYPPTNDQASETRRVEETLKRWELAERQRRKSVRESAQQTSGPSLFASVTRTASLVLSRRSGSISAAPNAFKPQDAVDVVREGYGVPLDDMDHTRASSMAGVAVHSPNASPSLFGHRASASLDATIASRRTSENPFVHPSERGARMSSSSSPPQISPLLVPVTSMRPLRPSTPPSPTPFSDARAQFGGAAVLTMRAGVEHSAHVRMQSSASIPMASVVPPPPPAKPRPLSPPSEDTSRAKQLQPTPTSQPVLRPSARREQEGREVVRWWHDWLCGCGEGPDRGGDSQAGRTNPFE